MGGGDLNMKKSWHVNTLSNIERVWKAEQKDAAEKRKIEELRKARLDITIFDVIPEFLA